MRLLTCCLFSALLLSGGAVAQSTPQEQAHAKGREAIYQMDHGHFPAAIELLEEAMKLDPASYPLAYEYAFAYYLQKEYGKAIKLGEKLTKHPDADATLYQMLGNSYDLNGDRKKAFAAYQTGLKRFPNAGELYTELGTMEGLAKNYNAALGYYEQGIEMDPIHTSNYFRTAQLYLASDHKVWGMLYGELYMLQEPKNDRTKALSRMLSEAYRESLTRPGDTAVKVSFENKNLNISLPAKASKKATMNLLTAALQEAVKMIGFPTEVYETKMRAAFLPEKTNDADALSRVRTRFLDSYYADSTYRKYPNVLFEYQRQVQQAGHLDAYNHWVLLQHDDAALDAWRHAHADAWNGFLTWLDEHPLEITAANRFHRSQYDKKVELKARTN